MRPSARLTESAVCLVADEHGMDLRLERFLKQHQQLDELSKRVLEINPKHGLIRQMARAGGRRRPARGARRSGRAAARPGAHRRGRAVARSGRLLAPHERVPGQGPGGVAAAGGARVSRDSAHGAAVDEPCRPHHPAAPGLRPGADGVRRLAPGQSCARHPLARRRWSAAARCSSRVWRSPPGTLLLYGALLSHVALACTSSIAAAA